MSAWERTRVMNLHHGGSLQERTGLALLKCLSPWAGHRLCRVQSCSYARHPATSCSQRQNCSVAGPTEISPNRMPLKDSFLMKVRQGMRQGTDPARRDACHPWCTARSVHPSHWTARHLADAHVTITICKTVLAYAVLVIFSGMVAFFPNNNNK